MKRLNQAAAVLLTVLLVAACSPAFAAGFTQLSNSTNFTIKKLDGSTITINAKSVSDPGSGQCWAYARNLYYKIWGVYHDNSFTGSSSKGWNYLRGMSDSERAINTANVKAFITAAPLGAVVRICGCTSSCSHFGDDGGECGHGIHSLLLVAKSSTGCTFLERQGSGLYTSQYTWKQFCDYWKSGKCYYFKYIKWPGARSAKIEETPLTGIYVFNKDDESRHDPYEASPLVDRYSAGSAVEVVATVFNEYNNMWYKLSDGSFVFSGDLDPNSSIVIHNSSITIPAGQRTKIDVTAVGSDGSDLILQANDPDVALISYDNEWVYGIKPGVTDIVVYSSSTGDSAVCTLTVTEPESYSDYSNSSQTSIYVSESSARRGLFGKFTPTETGYYIFESSYNHMDDVGYVFDSGWNCIYTDDDSGHNTDFRIRAYLYAGNTYYFEGRPYDISENGTLTIGFRYETAMHSITTNNLFTTEKPTTFQKDVLTFCFTPYETAEYLFVSNSEMDPRIQLYDCYWNTLDMDDDSGRGDNFALRYNLIAGNTYYLDVDFYGTSTNVYGTVQVGVYNIEKTPLMIPDQVAGIAAQSFYNTAAESILLPDSVSGIGSEAFAYCGNLGLIWIPEGCSTIAEDAFYGSGNVCIVGEEGSYAETYANSHFLSFAPLWVGYR